MDICKVFTLSFTCHKAKILEKTGNASLVTLQSFITQHQSARCQNREEKKNASKVSGPVEMLS